MPRRNLIPYALVMVHALTHQKEEKAPWPWLTSICSCQNIDLLSPQYSADKLNKACLGKLTLRGYRRDELSRSRLPFETQSFARELSFAKDPGSNQDFLHLFPPRPPPPLINSRLLLRGDVPCPSCGTRLIDLFWGAWGGGERSDNWNN